MKTPLTPQQALDNFQLFLTCKKISDVHGICMTILSLGITGDDKHPDPAKQSLRDAITFIEGTTPDEDDGEPIESVTTSVDDGPEFTFDLAAARRALEGKAVPVSPPQPEITHLTP